MTPSELFDCEPGSSAAAPPPEGPVDAARMQRPVRNQVELRMAALDDLVAPDHTARIVWAYVEHQDLLVLEEAIRAREHTRGRTPIDPRILMGLWLCATLDGMGSARELDRRCHDEIPYMWLCGGVSVNYHTLSDFRVGHGDVLDNLLTRDVAALLCEGLVELNRVAQDGMRTRASAGAASYRRAATLETCLTEAKAQVEALRKLVEEDPGAATKRQRAARERAARERQARVEQALARSQQLQEHAGSEDKKEKVRVSTTDPEIPVMKMADGGFRPAVNVELATQTATQIITGVEVTNRGTDQGEMIPMLEQHKERYETCPPEILVDGGFAKQDDIEKAAGPAFGATVFAPVPKPKKNAQRDRYAPLAGDSPVIAQWRQRMGTEQAQQIYKERAATAECVNAIARNRGLRQLTVRTLKKIRAAVLWYVLGHNLMRAHYLRAMAATA